MDSIFARSHPTEPTPRGPLGGAADVDEHNDTRVTKGPPCLCLTLAASYMSA